MKPRRVNPPHYFMGSLVLLIAVAQIDWACNLMVAPWRWLGIIAVVGGIAIAALAARQFGQAGTNIVPLTIASALVTDGMFRWSRNPMYLGMVSTLAGTAWLLNALLPWLVVVAFVVLLTLRFIRHEEALMAQTFGEQYLDYKGRVRRWV